MPQQIVIAEQLRIAAVLTEDRVDELVVAQGRYQIGDVYLGTVENVLPGIDAAFVISVNPKKMDSSTSPILDPCGCARVPPESRNCWSHAKRCWCR
jgi:hypothetical protein